mmetsp:Transcript_10750/g.16941  ORF Transcript_10750/g.16941 Transcript_10750/m.16941 type:complete len:363 (-) Transcript_10750:21-1109(-)
MGKNKSRTSKSSNAAASGVYQPGRRAVIKGLVNRPDLNGTIVIIKDILQDGRVAVSVKEGEGKNMVSSEEFSLKTENLEVQRNFEEMGSGGGMKKWGVDAQECPLCNDTIMSNHQNYVVMPCCGARCCRTCHNRIENTCPFCRSDAHSSNEGLLRKIRARAERGDPNAMYNLGTYYDRGAKGLVQNQALANAWYERAAENGELRGAYNLGCNYRNGEGGPVDLTLASKYFRIAAEMGHVQAATNLGIALMNGLGVRRDFEEAKVWLDKGASAGDQIAVQELHTLDFLMSSMGGSGHGAAMPRSFSGRNESTSSSPSTRDARECLVCKENTTLRCQRCKKAAFCSRACQKAGWRSHKKICCSK